MKVYLSFTYQGRSPRDGLRCSMNADRDTVAEQ